MRIAIAIVVSLAALPAAAQFSGMPGCDQQLAGVCQNNDQLSGTDYENIRAYLAALSAAGAHAWNDVPEAGDFGALALTGDVTSSGLATTIGANSVALSADTTGFYASGDAENGNATSGDSATAFFSSGTIEDARIPTAITRDSEVASQTFSSSDPPGTCTQGNWHHQDSTTDRSCVCIATNTWRCWTTTAP